MNRALETVAGAILLSIFVLGSIASGAVIPDALRGYPPGASESVTWHGQVHNATGPVMFIAIFAATLTVASQVTGAWRAYTMLTAIVGLAMTVWTAVSFQRDSAYTGLVQRGLILVYMIWIVLRGITSPEIG